ncbi:M23 family metallopeptidase [uncultured Draconibacterium sp.]|uniref:M23 family metallopeptidase n=1 Tax=uncultured Draconibacterium sp. TaxID=1573823 RepID=UPI003260DFD9
MKIFFTYFLFLISVLSTAQQRYYSNPLKIPLLLSGSFAELRTNHFHSGIDIKTQGVTGLPVYAVADGYISRIVVSPTGYGKALYLNHANGTTTVYGHLNSFTPAIEKFVKDKQYEKKSFRVDLQVPPYLFAMKQDQEIGKSGNSGSSGGPHLHFEIRDTQTEEPLNPLQYDFPITDNIAPKIFSVILAPLTKQSHINGSNTPQTYQAEAFNGTYRLKNNPEITFGGEIGVGIETNDYFNGSYNKCGISMLRMSVNDVEQFTFSLNRFSFSTSRYINSHIVYSAYKTTKRRYIKTWLDPGNKLPIYTHNGTEGRLVASDAETKKVNIELQDTYGNSSRLAFSLQGNEMTLQNDSTRKPVFYYQQTNTFRNETARIEIPRDALYADFEFEYRTEPSWKELYTDYHFFHNNTVPLHKNAIIALRADSLPLHLQTKVLLAYVNPSTGEFNSAGGNYENGWVSTETRNLGVYALTVDTIPPEIEPLSVVNNSLTESNRIRFKIKDDLAGIKSIEGFIDEKWALFEYDAKTGIITHYFDAERFVLGKTHNFKLSVSDYRNNTAIYKASFWK